VKTKLSNKLELQTFAGKTIQAYKDQAAKAGIVLRAPSDVTESGDFPRRIYDSLRHFRRNIAITQNHRKVVTSIHRQLVSERDDKGRPTKKEYIFYKGYYSGTTHKGEEYHANYEIGKYEKPKIVPNSNIRYNPKTGEPIGNEKMLGGPETVYTIEVPKSKTERKKLIDEIIGDNFPEEIKYYFDNEDEPLGRSDNTFTYSEFCDDTIEELRKKSFQGGGSLTPGIWRDNDGKLRDKFGQVLTPESGNKGAYQ
jgi:hypothetical protein